MNLANRVSGATALIAAAMIGIGWIAGAGAASTGFAIGAGIGLFSLWSFTVVIPRLAGQDSNAGRFWLGLLLLAKLPIYAGILVFAMTSPLVHPFAVFVGAGLIPMVIIGTALSSLSGTGRAPVRATGQRKG